MHFDPSSTFRERIKIGLSVARELSLFVACEILKKAPAEALKPHCVTAVEALLEALSTFEDTRLNYYEQRVTAMFGNDTDANGNNSVVENFQNARVQASSNSIISDALDAFIQHVDLEETKLLAPVFTNIFKKGLGLNTKVGAGRFAFAYARDDQMQRKAFLPVRFVKRYSRRQMF